MNNIKMNIVTIKIDDLIEFPGNVRIHGKRNLDALKKSLEVYGQVKNIIVQNDFQNNEYPLASLASGHDEVYIGRIRRDFSVDSGINFWCVSDNVRKGAASNAVQIALALDLDKCKK